SAGGQFIVVRRWASSTAARASRDWRMRLLTNHSERARPPSVNAIQPVRHQKSTEPNGGVGVVTCVWMPITTLIANRKGRRASQPTRGGGGGICRTIATSYGWESSLRLDDLPVDDHLGVREGHIFRPLVLYRRGIVLVLHDVHGGKEPR